MRASAREGFARFAERFCTAAAARLLTPRAAGPGSETPDHGRVAL